MTETLLPIVQKINGYLSDYILVALLIAVGLWYSIKTRFVQVRHFKEGWAGTACSAASVSAAESRRAA